LRCAASHLQHVASMDCTARASSGDSAEDILQLSSERPAPAVVIHRAPPVTSRACSVHCACHMGSLNSHPCQALCAMHSRPPPRSAQPGAHNTSFCNTTVCKAQHSSFFLNSDPYSPAALRVCVRVSMDHHLIETARNRAL